MGDKLMETGCLFMGLTWFLSQGDVEKYPEEICGAIVLTFLGGLALFVSGMVAYIWS